MFPLNEGTACVDFAMSSSLYSHLSGLAKSLEASHLMDFSEGTTVAPIIDEPVTRPRVYSNAAVSYRNSIEELYADANTPRAGA